MASQIRAQTGNARDRNKNSSYICGYRITNMGRLQRLSQCLASKMQRRSMVSALATLLSRILSLFPLK